MQFDILMGRSYDTFMFSLSSDASFMGNQKAQEEAQKNFKDSEDSGKERSNDRMTLCGKIDNMSYHLPIS